MPEEGQPGHERFVFNLVWTEGAFEYLGLFTVSLLAHSGARFRFVANGCRPDEVESMERFAARHAGRITDVLVVATGQTLRHGDALDETRDQRDDGTCFCFIDPDILATGAFLDDFEGALDSCAAVTSGRELWSDHNVVPEAHPGLNGEYFFRSDGYVYGSPHFAMYDAAALDETVERWGVGFGNGGQINDALRERLRAAGHGYLLYDTAKLVNILLQEDGHRLHHMEHDHLLHIGGLLHYLWAPRVEADGGEIQVDWASWGDMTARHEVARYTAAACCGTCSTAAPPPRSPSALQKPCGRRWRPLAMPWSISSRPTATRGSTRSASALAPNGPRHRRTTP